MNKKGTIKTVVGISILLIFLAVFLLAIFAPGEGLAPQIAAAADLIADKALGGSREEKSEKSSLQVDPAVQAAYDDIVEKLGDPGKGPCILEHRAFPKDFNDFRIILEKTPDNNILARIVRQKSGGEQIFDSQIIDNIPCVVSDKRSKNFIDNHLDGSKCTSSTCPLDYLIVGSIEFRDRDHIFVFGTADEGKKDIEKGSLLFKNRDGNVCFFQKDDYDKNTIESNLRECSTVRPGLPSIPIPDSEIEAYYQIDVDVIDISWTEPTDGAYALVLKKEGEEEPFVDEIFHDHALILFNQHGLDGTETLTGSFIKHDSNSQPVENYQEFTIDLTQKASLSSEPLPGFPDDEWNVVWYDDPKNKGFKDSNKLGSTYPEFLFAGPSITSFNKNFGKNKEIAYGKDDHIGLQAKRSICFDKGDKIEFDLGSDDGSRLYMDGELKIDNWGDHGYRVKSFEHKFSVDACHSFLIEYYENDGNAQIYFETN